MKILSYPLFILSKIYLLIGYYPLLLCLKILFWKKYKVKVFHKWTRGSHFSYILYSCYKKRKLFLKIRNALSSTYNKFSGFPQPTTKQQLDIIRSLPPEVQKIFPEILMIKGMIAMNYEENVTAIDPFLLDQNQKTDVLDAISKKLNMLHQNGYAHGDIKLKNILFNQNSKELFFIDIDYIQPLSESLKIREQQQESALQRSLNFTTNEK